VRATQAVLMVFGAVIAAYGFVLLWDNPRVILFRIVVWALAGVVLHDLVFAPVCAAVGFAARRLIPNRWWAPVALAALCTVVLVMLAIPVYDKPGMRPDNLTVLDRDYHAGLWISLVIVWACVPVYLLATRLLPVRQNQVVERERADDVEGQPPAVG
jgi:hypothetical protein